MVMSVLDSLKRPLSYAGSPSSHGEPLAFAVRCYSSGMLLVSTSPATT